jgi:hypothetical protein
MSCLISCGPLAAALLAAEEIRLLSEVLIEKGWSDIFVRIPVKKIGSS